MAFKSDHATSGSQSPSYLSLSVPDSARTEDTCTRTATKANQLKPFGLDEAGQRRVLEQLRAFQQRQEARDDVALPSDHGTLHQQANSRSDLGEQLIRACRRGHEVALMRHLGQEDIDLEYKGCDGYTPLASACLYGHANIVAGLLQDGRCNLNAIADKTGKNGAYDRRRST